MDVAQLVHEEVGRKLLHPTAWYTVAFTALRTVERSEDVIEGCADVLLQAFQAEGVLAGQDSGLGEAVQADRAFQEGLHLYTERVLATGGRHGRSGVWPKPLCSVYDLKPTIRCIM